MDEQRVTVWCNVMGQLVEAALVKAGQVQPPIPGVPEGWKVAECLNKDVDCFGKGCAFTTDGGELPFGERWQVPESPQGSTDPSGEEEEA